MLPPALHELEVKAAVWPLWTPHASESVGRRDALFQLESRVLLPRDGLLLPRGDKGGYAQDTRDP